MFAKPVATGLAYALDSNSEVMRVNLINGAVVASVPLTVAGESVVNVVSWDRQPGTADYFALVELAGQATHELVTVDPDSGVATPRGDTGRYLDAIAFDDAGTLFAVPSANDSDPTHLVTLNPTTGAATASWEIGPATQRATLAFNPDDGKLYHFSGTLPHVDVFESIAPDTGTRRFNTFAR